LAATITKDNFLETTNPSVQILRAEACFNFDPKFDQDMFRRQANALVASMMEALRISQDLSKLEKYGIKASDFTPGLDFIKDKAVLALGQ
jgi:hypothetical protein